MRQPYPAKVLRLKAQVSAAHPGGVGRNEQAGDTGEQDGLKGAKIPVIGCDVVEVVMGVELPVLVDDMGLALDIGDEQLRRSCQGRINAVDGTIPIRRGFLCDVTLGDLVLSVSET